MKDSISPKNWPVTVKTVVSAAWLLIFGILLAAVRPVSAAEVAVIKSNEIGPYNQALEGFVKEIGAGVDEYNLRGDIDNLPGITDKIQKGAPKLIFALGSLAAAKAKENFPAIPVIYTMVLTPEGKGLSGGNTTGISIEADNRQQLAVLMKAVPSVKKVGVLYSQLTEHLIASAREDCRELGLELVAVRLRYAKEVPERTQTLLSGTDALWLVPDSLVINEDSLHYLLMLTLENRVPFMVYNKGFVKAGALLSPVVDYAGIGRQAGRLGRRALQGYPLPAVTLPPEEVEWAINLRTARNIGLAAPSWWQTFFKYVYK